jgi:hypothetical protein
MSNQHEEQELTQEELTARKEEMKKFYEDSIPYLEAQAKYEKLLTEIDEARFKRSTLNYQWAQFINNTAPKEGGEEEDELDTVPPFEQEDTSARKLKKS